MRLQCSLGGPWKGTVAEAQEISASNPAFIRTGNGFLTTAEVLAEGRVLLGHVESDRGKFEPAGGSQAWEISDPRVRANEEQSLAVERVLRFRDLITSDSGRRRHR